MFNVLHVMYGADAGGISSVILNYYRHLVEHGFHFDLALTSDQIGLNAKRFRELGSHIYRLPSKSEGIGAYETALAKRGDASGCHSDLVSCSVGSMTCTAPCTPRSSTISTAESSRTEMAAY